MQVSEKGLAFVAAREALCLTVHKDTRRPVVGFGINDDTLVLGATIEFDEAIERFVKVAPDYDADVNNVFGDVPFEQHHHDGMFSLDWNAGGTDLRRATALIDAVKRFVTAPSGTPEEKVLRARLRDRAAFQFTQVKYDAETDAYFNLIRRMQEGALFGIGAYGDISQVKFYDKGQFPKPIVIDGVLHAPSDPVMIPMPVFRK